MEIKNRFTSGCTILEVTDFNFSKFFWSFNEKPKDIEAHEALRDGVLDMAGMK